MPTCSLVCGTNNGEDVGQEARCCHKQPTRDRCCISSTIVRMSGSRVLPWGLAASGAHMISRTGIC